MSSRRLASSRGLIFALIAVLFAAQTAQGGFCRFGFRNQGVGGVSIDAHGVVSMPTVEERGMLAKGVREITGKAPDAMTAPVGMRKISLRRLEEAIQEAHRKGHIGGIAVCAGRLQIAASRNHRLEQLRIVQYPVDCFGRCGKDHATGGGETIAV